MYLVRSLDQLLIKQFSAFLKGGAMENKNLIGIKIVGIVGVIMGVIELTMFLGALFVNALFSAALVLMYGLSIIISAIFILKLKNWARIVFIVLILGSMIFWLQGEYAICASNIAHGFSVSILEIFVFLIVKGIIPALCIYYLTRPKVKEQFK